MKAYLATTGSIFLLLVLAHIWRMIWENRELATDPFFALLTLLAAALAVWAAWLLWRKE